MCIRDRNNTDKVYKVYLLEDESVIHLYQCSINTAIKAYATHDDIVEEWEKLH